MIITIPLSPDQTVPDIVTASLNLQSWQWSRKIIKAGKSSIGLTRDERIKNIVLSRNACLDKMAIYNFGLMHDSSCRMLIPSNIQEMIDYLMAHNDFAAVALSKMELKGDALELEHITMGSVVVRPGVLDIHDIRFRADNEMCECRNFCADIRAIGLRIGYLDGKKRIEHKTTRTQTLPGGY
jgi:hypothetical protein